MLRVFAYIGCLLFYACNQVPEKDMISVATPIQFQPETTLVYLEDYFVKPHQIDSISTELNYQWNKANATITFIENPSSAMANIRFWID